MRSMWKGTVSFGLVTIPVRLYSATEEKDISFHQVRRSDGSRVRYRRVAEVDGEEVAYSDIAKGYQLPSGDTVILTDEDFADLPLPTTRVVDVLQFVPIDQVDPILYSRSYYLEPDNTAAKPYVLLREALESSGMVGVVKVAIRSKEQLAVLRVRENVIVMETMIWPDEVREPEFGFLDQEIALRPQELSMAESLIASMAGDFDPNAYHDDYRTALQQVIDAKVEGREIVETVSEDTSKPANVVDLMAALRASVEAAKAARGGAASAATPAADTPAARAAARKASAAKSAPAKAAPATKAPAKQAPAKKAAKVPAKKVAPVAASKKTAPAKKSPTKIAAAKQASAKKATTTKTATRVRKTA